MSRTTSYDTAAVLDVVGCGSGNAGVTTRFLIPFEQVDRQHAAPPPRVVPAARWRHAARAVLAGASESPVTLRTAARAAIRVMPFQLEPALALLGGSASRILIADDVGLGKTVQAGLILAELLERNAEARAIVVCPAALREQWQTELRDRFALPAAIIDAAYLSRAQLNVAARINPWSAHALVITSIDYLKRPEVIRALETLVWDAAVFDEAHALAGRSDRAGAAALVAERARQVVMLTATPHSGDERAFQRLCTLGDLAPTFPLLLFRRRRRDVGLAADRRTIWLPVTPTAAEAAMHRGLASYARRVWASQHTPASPAGLAMSVLTRRACSSAASFLRSLQRRAALLSQAETPGELQLALPFGDADADDEPGRELAAPGLASRREELLVLADLMQLAERAAGGESKIAVLHRLLRRTAQPALVFTEYRDTLTSLAAEFAALCPLQLHGGMTPRERREAARGFTAGSARLLLATDAASEGLNLHQRCRLVVNLELPWTPMRLEQRIGRIDRIGQVRRVHAVHLVAATSSEQTVVARLLSRLDAASGALGETVLGAAEREIARVAFGGEEGIPVTASTAVQRGYLAADTSMRNAAVHEAAFIHTLRRVSALRREPRAEPAPLLTVFRRGASRRCWLFELAYADAGGSALWHELLGIAAAGNPAWSRDRASTRRLLDVDAALATVIRRQHAARVGRLREALEPALAAARLRELAIVDAVRARRARMAALLVQPSLFGRAGSLRQEEQATAADELIARCEAHLRRIDLARVPVPSGSALLLAFASGR